MASIFDKARSAWNAFTNEEKRPVAQEVFETGVSGSYHPQRVRMTISNERSMLAAMYTRIAMDIASIDIKHIEIDDDDRFVREVKSALNDCFTFEANLDQAPRDFRQDLILQLFDTGVAAIVAVDTSQDVTKSDGFDVHTMRVGRVVEWFPQHVKIELYDERDGNRKQIKLPKASVCIIQNPLFNVMNEHSSTLQRLIRKLNMLDSIDEQSSSGKLDLIIQLPYVVKSETRKAQAEDRRRSIEAQMKGSQYGIAYVDATEKITQLNRPAENNLLAQIQYLMEIVYAQLGLTKGVFDGTASEEEMLNYHNRTVAPILESVTQNLQRAFISKNARGRGERIKYFRNPFSMLTLANLGEIGDKLTRNEIATSNEVRGFIGMRPSKDPKADELRNKNLPEAVPPPEPVQEPTPEPTDTESEEELQNGT